MNEVLIKKTRKSMMISFALTLLICISSLVLMSGFNTIQKNSEQLSKSIETQWRSYTQVILEGFEGEMLEAINTNNLNPYDDEELNTWVMRNLPFLKNKGFIDNFAIVNIGYTVRDTYLDLELSVLNTDSDTENIIKDAYKSILKDVYDKDVPYILKRIDEESVRLHQVIPFISTATIRQLYIEALMLDDTLSSTTSVYDINQLNSDACWTESISIPNGILGFNSEPPYINNEKNPIYRKVSIYVSINKDDIMSNYDTYNNSTRHLANFSMCLLLVIFIVSIIAIAILFINTINKNGGVYDANIDHKSSVGCDIDNVHVTNSRDE